jgi:hypothetical protein
MNILQVTYRQFINKLLQLLSKLIYANWYCTIVQTAFSNILQTTYDKYCSCYTYGIFNSQHMYKRSCFYNGWVLVALLNAIPVFYRPNTKYFKWNILQARYRQYFELDENLSPSSGQGGNDGMTEAFIPMETQATSF